MCKNNHNPCHGCEQFVPLVKGRNTFCYSFIVAPTLLERSDLSVHYGVCLCVSMIAALLGGLLQKYSDF